MSKLKINCNSDMIFPKKNSKDTCPVCGELRALYSNTCNCGYIFRASGICSCGSGKQRILFSHNCEECAK